MKYIVKGEFFDAESTLDLDASSIAGEYSAVELCEVGGNVMYAETGNFRLASWFVVAMAISLGCDGLLRMEVPEIAEEFELQMTEIEDGA